MHRQVRGKRGRLAEPAPGQASAVVVDQSPPAADGEVGPPEDPEDAGGGLKLPGLGNLFGFGGKKDDNVKQAGASDQDNEKDAKSK